MMTDCSVDSNPSDDLRWCISQEWRVCFLSWMFATVIQPDLLIHHTPTSTTFVKISSAWELVWGSSGKGITDLNMPIELKLSHSYESESQELDSSLVSSSESASRASVSVVDHRNKLESKSCWCIRTKILRNTRADEITHSSRWDNSAGAYCLQKG
jgi:hypothetical protein